MKLNESLRIITKLLKQTSSRKARDRVSVGKRSCFGQKPGKPRGEKPERSKGGLGSRHALCLVLLAFSIVGCGQQAPRHQSSQCAANLLRIEKALNSFHQQNGVYPRKLKDLKLGPLQCSTNAADTYSDTYKTSDKGRACIVYCSQARTSKMLGGAKAYGVYDSQSKRITYH